ELHAAVLAVPARVFTEIGPFNPELIDTESADYRGRLTERYRVKITDAVRGVHDHDPTLRQILRNVFRRARLSAAQWRQGETPGDSVPRAIAGLLLIGGVAAMPLALLGPIGALTSPALVAAAVALGAGTYRYFRDPRGLAEGVYFCGSQLVVPLTGALTSPALVAAAGALDAGTYRYFFAHRGLAVGLYFCGIHLLVTLTGAVGGVVGVLQRLLSRRSAAAAGYSLSR